MAHCTQIEFKQGRKMYDNQVLLSLSLFFSKIFRNPGQKPFSYHSLYTKEEDCTWHVFHFISHRSSKK